jgi:hypothetical protein
VIDGLAHGCAERCVERTRVQRERERERAIVEQDDGLQRLAAACSRRGWDSSR